MYHFCYNKNMKKILIIIALAAISFVGIRAATAPTDLEYVSTYNLPSFIDLSQVVSPYSNTKVAVAIDNTIAYSNTDATQATASTAKMITALMVMEKKPFELGEKGETITISQEFYQKYIWYITHNGSNAAVAVGERISQYDALAAALLPSSNNFADTLAIWAFGSLDAYKEYATQRLADWGLKNTTIGIDASGYSSTTTSTASDLAIIGQRVMSNPVLAEIVGLKTHTIPVAGQINNTNQLLGIDNIVGIKTGYTGSASGYCLITAYYIDDHLVTIAMLNAPTRSESFSISRAIVEDLQKNLNYTKVVSKGDQLGYYDSWWIDKVPIESSEDLSVLGWSGVQRTVSLDMEDGDGKLKVKIGSNNYEAAAKTQDLQLAPTFWQRIRYALNLI